MKKILLTLCGLTALTLTSCKGCECRYQGDLDNERWEMRQHRRMQFRDRIKVKADMHKKMHERNKKHHKKG